MSRVIKNTLSFAYAKCVVKILNNLKHAYETRALTSFHESGMNTIRRRTIVDADTIKNIIQNSFKRLCSATDIEQSLR